MNNLMIFEGRHVEVFEFKGDVLFNPKHVAECLGIKNVNDNIRGMNDKQVIKLRNSDIGKADIRKLNNAGENFLKESGVYKLIFKSHKEESEKFQDWVTDEVLPAIRKTGGYIPHNQEDDDATIMAKALLISQKTIEKKNAELKIAEEENLKLSRVIEGYKPKVDYVDKILSCSDAMLVTNIAFDYGLSAIALNKILCEEKIQRKVRGQYILYADYMGKGYTETETEEYGGKSRTQTLWTQKGRMLIHQVLKERDINPVKDIDQVVHKDNVRQISFN